MRIWLSWSSGKDSAWALHVLRGQPDVEVVGLLTTFNQASDRVAMHAVRHALATAQADAVGLPLHAVELPWPCSNDDYAERMTAVCAQAKSAGIEAIAFGDLFLEDIRAYREKQLEPTGLGVLFPLWQRPTAELAREMVQGGLRAVLTCVDPRQLDPEFVGRTYDEALLDDLPPSVDPCGENGEFHTFVYDGPMLARPIPVETGERVEREGFHYCDVVPLAVNPKRK